MQDTRIISDIVNAVRPQPDDIVIEIGPGLAAITEPLAKKLNRLHVCEIDRDIVRRLKTLPFADKLVIHEGDVLQFDFNSIEGKKKNCRQPAVQYFHAAFVPIERSGRRCDRYALYAAKKEVVERMVAQPKTNDYGRLGVMLQYFFDMEMLIEVPPESFDPAPKVDSAVVRMIPVKHRIGKAEDFEHFAKLVKLAFHQRRKTIRNNLKELAGDDDLQAVGINPQDRAEHIAAEKYVALSNYLVQKAV